MCRKAWVIVPIVCVIVLISRVHRSGGGSDAHSQAKRSPAAAAPKAAPAPATTVRETGEVVKYGKTAEAAKQLALEESRDWVAAYLAKQNPPLDWPPDVEYIQQRKMVTFSDAQEVETGEEGHKEKFQKVTATVEITDDTFKDMQKQDQKFHSDQRKLVSKDRQTLLAKILAGVVATLAAVAIYLRLDDATKGYYSLWLRLGSVALVATVGAGAWMLL